MAAAARVDQPSLPDAVPAMTTSAAGVVGPLLRCFATTSARPFKSIVLNRQVPDFAATSSKTPVLCLLCVVRSSVQPGRVARWLGTHVVRRFGGNRKVGDSGQAPRRGRIPGGLSLEAGKALNEAGVALPEG